MLDVDVTEYVKANRQRLFDEANARWDKFKEEFRAAQRKQEETE